MEQQFVIRGYTGMIPDLLTRNIMRRNQEPAGHTAWGRLNLIFYSPRCPQPEALTGTSSNRLP